MNITMIAPSLAAGGAERAVTLHAKAFLAKGYTVAVITLSGDEQDFHKLPAAITRHALRIDTYSPTPLHGFFNNIQRLLLVRRAIRSTQPAVVISHLDQTNVLTAFSLFKTRIPLIVVEHIDPRMLSPGKVWKILRRIAYRRVSKLVSVSRGVDGGFSWLPLVKRTVVYNPVVVDQDAQTICEPLLPNSTHKWIVAMGRLSYQKGFDILLTAFHRVAAKHPDWQLIIMGEGELKCELQDLVAQLELRGRVHFLGLVQEPQAFLRRASLFAMASRFEGFPYSLLEAMACGVAAIYTDCPSGPSEIIRDGIDGILVAVGDTEGLANALHTLMSNHRERARLAQQALEVQDRFGIDRIMAQWQMLIAEVTSEAKLPSSF